MICVASVSMECNEEELDGDDAVSSGPPSLCSSEEPEALLSEVTSCSDEGEAEVAAGDPVAAAAEKEEAEIVAPAADDVETQAPPTGVFEACHFRNCLLQEYGSLQFLIHKLTGEVVRVYGANSVVTGGPWKLQFIRADSGDSCFGYLVSEMEDEVIKLADVFDKRIFQGSRPGFSNLQRFVYSKKSRVSCWLHEGMQRIECKVFDTRWGDIAWKSEIYVHEIPKDVGCGVSCNVFFAMPWLVSAIFDYSNHDKGNFIGKNHVSWQGLLTEMKLTSAHLRPSSKSLISQLYHKEEAVPTHLRMSSEIEFSISSAGLLALLLHWHVSRKIKRMRTAVGEANKSVAHGLLTCLVKSMLGDVKVAWWADHDILMIVEHGRVALDVLLRSQGNVRGKVGRDCGDSCMVEVLVYLLTHARSSRHTSLDRARHYRCLGACLLKLGFLLDEAAKRGEQDHISLGVLHSAHETRRISGAFKKAVADHTNSSKNCRRPSQLLAGMTVGAIKEERGDSCAARTGENFEAFQAYQYFLGCRELFAAERVISVALDGTRVCGGKDSISFAAWSASHEQGCWLPVQVFSGKSGVRCEAFFFVLACVFFGFCDAFFF